MTSEVLDWPNYHLVQIEVMLKKKKKSQSEVNLRRVQNAGLDEFSKLHL